MRYDPVQSIAPNPYIKVRDKFPKVELMQALIEEFGPATQVFQSDVYGFFSAGLFRKLLIQHGLKHFEAGRMPMDPMMVKYIQENVEISAEHLNRMSLAQIEEPVFVVTLDDEEPHFLIDGHHRIIKRFQLGLPDIKMFLADREMTDIINFQKGPLT